MVKEFEVRWEGELPASPQAVWDAITRHADGYLWPIEYEPRVGGAERGLTQGGGTVTVWEPPRHFATRTRPEHERDGLNEIDFRARAARRRHVPALHAPGRDPGGRVRPPARRVPRAHDLLPALARAVRVLLPGRTAAYVSVERRRRPPPAASSRCCARSGVPDDVVAGDRVRLTPAGEPIEGVDRLPTRAFLGVRSADALFRVVRARRVGLAGRHRPPPVRRRCRRGGERAGVGRLGRRGLRRGAGGVMAQYAVLIYERVAPGGPSARGACRPTGAAGRGSPSWAGGIVAGMALRAARDGDLDPRRRASPTGRSSRRRRCSAASFVIEARDLDHALALAKLTPIVDGGVEVRPLLGFQVAGAEPDATRRAGGGRRAPSRVGLRARRDGARDARPRRAPRRRCRTRTCRRFGRGRATACPARPGAWLTTVARRARAQRAAPPRETLDTKLPLLLEPDDAAMPDPPTPTRSPTTGCGWSSPAATRRCRGRRRSR